MGVSCNKLFAAVVTAVYFLVNGVFLHAVESNFWKERRTTADSQSSAPGAMASLPASSNALQVLKGLPDIQSRTLSPTVMDALSAEAGESVVLRHMDVLRAVPPAHGSIRRLTSPVGRNAGWTVVFLQDVHENDEAQSNLGKVVESLMSRPEANVSFFGLEAAFSPLEIEKYRTFPNRNAVRETAAYLLEEHGISGPVHAAYTFEGKVPPFLGVDDPVLYESNVESYRRSAPMQRAARRALAVERFHLEREKKQVYNADLKVFDKTVTGYHGVNQETSFGDYARAVALASGTSSGSLAQFLQALDAEKSLDFKAVEKERARLIEDLVRKLDKGRIDELVRFSLDYRVGNLGHEDYYRSLRDFCRRSGVDLSAYPAMDAYVRYVLLTGRINVEKLFTALREAEAAGYARLAKTPEEKHLAERSRRMILEAKLLDFSLTPDEWAEYAASPRGGSFDSFEAFYRAAEDRNHAMTENILKAMEERGAEAAVLVAGGFHTAGMTNLLSARGVTVVEVSPKLTKVEGSGSAYLGVFTQEKTPLERLFKGDRLFVAKTPDKANGTGEGPVLVALHNALDKQNPAAAEAAFRELTGGAGRIKVGPLRETGATAVISVPGKSSKVLARLSRNGDGSTRGFTLMELAGALTMLTVAAVAAVSYQTYLATALAATAHFVTAGVSLAIGNAVWIAVSVLFISLFHKPIRHIPGWASFFLAVACGDPTGGVGAKRPPSFQSEEASVPGEEVVGRIMEVRPSVSGLASRTPATRAVTDIQVDEMMKFFEDMGEVGGKAGTANPMSGMLRIAVLNVMYDYLEGEVRLPQVPETSGDVILPTEAVRLLMKVFLERFDPGSDLWDQLQAQAMRNFAGRWKNTGQFVEKDFHGKASAPFRRRAAYLGALHILQGGAIKHLNVAPPGFEPGASEMNQERVDRAMGFLQGSSDAHFSAVLKKIFEIGNDVPSRPIAVNELMRAKTPTLLDLWGLLAKYKNDRQFRRNVYPRILGMMAEEAQISERSVDGLESVYLVHLAARATVEWENILPKALSVVEEKKMVEERQAKEALNAKRAASINAYYKTLSYDDKGALLLFISGVNRDVGRSDILAPMLLEDRDGDLGNMPIEFILNQTPEKRLRIVDVALGVYKAGERPKKREVLRKFNEFVDRVMASQTGAVSPPATRRGPTGQVEDTDEDGATGLSSPEEGTSVSPEAVVAPDPQRSPTRRTGERGMALVEVMVPLAGISASIGGWVGGVALAKAGTAAFLSGLPVWGMGALGAVAAAGLVYLAYVAVRAIRRPYLQKFIAQGGRPVVVVMVGGSNVRVGLNTDVGPAGYASTPWKNEATPDETRRGIENAIQAAWEKLFAGYGVRPDQVGGVAYSWAGPGRYEDGLVRGTNIPGFREEDLRNGSQVNVQDGYFNIAAFTRRMFEYDYGVRGIRVQVAHDGQSATGDRQLLVRAERLSPAYLAGRPAYGGTAYEGTGRAREISDGIGEVGHHFLASESDGKANMTYDPPADGSLKYLRQAENLVAGIGAAFLFMDMWIREQGEDTSLFYNGLSTETLAKRGEGYDPASLRAATSLDEPDKRDKEKIDFIHAVWQERLSAGHPVAVLAMDEMARRIGLQAGRLIEAYPTGYFIANILGTGNGAGFWSTEDRNLSTVISLVGGFIENAGKSAGFMEKVHNVAAETLGVNPAEIRRRIILSPNDASRDMYSFLAETPGSEKGHRPVHTDRIQSGVMPTVLAMVAAFWSQGALSLAGWTPLLILSGAATAGIAVYFRKTIIKGYDRLAGLFRKNVLPAAATGLAVAAVLAAANAGAGAEPMTARILAEELGPEIVQPGSLDRLDRAADYGGVPVGAALIAAASDPLVMNNPDFRRSLENRLHALQGEGQLPGVLGMPGATDLLERGAARPLSHEEALTAVEGRDVVLAALVARSEDDLAVVSRQLAPYARGQQGEVLILIRPELESAAADVLRAAGMSDRGRVLVSASVPSAGAEDPVSEAVLASSVEPWLAEMERKGYEPGAVSVVMAIPGDMARINDLSPDSPLLSKWGLALLLFFPAVSLFVGKVTDGLLKMIRFVATMA